MVFFHNVYGTEARKWRHAHTSQKTDGSGGSWLASRRSLHVQIVRHRCPLRWTLSHRLGSWNLRHTTRQRPTPLIGHSVERCDRHQNFDIRAKRTAPNLGLAREFVWTFETTDVAWPIIGANCLHHFGAISVVDTDVDVIKIVPLPQKWLDILRSFPSVTRESPVPDKFQHELHTTGPPLFSRPRRLPSADTASHIRSSSTYAKMAFVDHPQAPWPVHCYLYQKRTALFSHAEITTDWTK